MGAAAKLEDYDLRNELDRKTIGTIERIYRQYQQGKLSASQASVALEAVFEAVGGLASDDIIMLLGEVRERLPRHPLNYALYSNPTGGLAFIKTYYASPELMVGICEAPAFQCKTKTFEDEANPYEARQMAIEKFIKNLDARTYRPL